MPSLHVYDGVVEGVSSLSVYDGVAESCDASPANCNSSLTLADQDHFT